MDSPAESRTAQRAMLIASLVHADVPLERQIDLALARGADLVELRVDRIGDVDAVEAALRSRPGGNLIVTVRCAEEGGAWDGGDDERIALIERLGLLTPGYIDIELATWNRSANVRQKIGLVCRADRSASRAARLERPRNALILSHHDFRGTPAALDALLDAFGSAPAAIAKLALLAREASDAMRVLDLMRRRAHERPLIALSMGEAGLIPRVLAARFGGFATFAALERGREAAPGQPTLDELAGTYRWRALSARTAVFGVVGWPVAQSRGPQVHNDWMRRAGIDGVYLPWPVGPRAEDWDRFVDAVGVEGAYGIRGLSVTIPHKEHALAWLTTRGRPVSAFARRAGAVNTLVRAPDGMWRGENTDGAGVLESLAGALGGAARLSGLRVEILGAGGAARAAAAALLDAGASVALVNRTAARAAALAAELGCAWRAWEARGSDRPDVLVNCTRVGMAPSADESPMPSERLLGVGVVLDSVYTPSNTRLLQDARACGCAVVEGIEMFVHQAARQFEFWHGCAADPDDARKLLRGLIA